MTTSEYTPERVKALIELHSIARGTKTLDQAAPAMYEALYKIAYLPFGESEASTGDVLNDITELARETIKMVRP